MTKRIRRYTREQMDRFNAKRRVESPYGRSPGGTVWRHDGDGNLQASPIAHVTAAKFMAVWRNLWTHPIESIAGLPLEGGQHPVTMKKIL